MKKEPKIKLNTEREKYIWKNGFYAGLDNWEFAFSVGFLIGGIIATILITVFE